MVRGGCGVRQANIEDVYARKEVAREVQLKEQVVQSFKGRIEVLAEQLSALAITISRPPHCQSSPQHVEKEEGDYNVEEDEDNLFVMNRSPRRNPVAGESSGRWEFQELLAA